jgi:hypothetical protein
MNMVRHDNITMQIILFAIPYFNGNLNKTRNLRIVQPVHGIIATLVQFLRQGVIGKGEKSFRVAERLVAGRFIGARRFTV